MDRRVLNQSKGLRRISRANLPIGPMVWIVVLLTCWLAIANWGRLPDAIGSTMAGLL